MTGDKDAHIRSQADLVNTASRHAYSKFSVFHNSTTPYPQNHQRITQDPHYLQYPHDEYTQETTFDDAPGIVYGIVERIRTTVDCNEVEQDCADLERERKVVYCDLPRFR